MKILKHIPNVEKKPYTITIVSISFKLNNIFISINNIIKLIEVFLLNKLLKYYSCGLISKKNKNSLKNYNIISNKLKSFLTTKNIKKITLILKSSKKIKYVFLNILLNIFYKNKLTHINDIYINFSIPFNGCRLKKRKFL